MYEYEENPRSVELYNFTSVNVLCREKTSHIHKHYMYTNIELHTIRMSTCRHVVNDYLLDMLAKVFCVASLRVKCTNLSVSSSSS